MSISTIILSTLGVIGGIVVLLLAAIGLMFIKAFWHH